MRVITARDLDSADCEVVGCPVVAELGSRRCRHHSVRSSGSRRSLDDVLERMARIRSPRSGAASVVEKPEVEDSMTVREVPARPCKREGCSSPANTRYDRGSFALLCEKHVEDERLVVSERLKLAHPSRRGKDPKIQANANVSDGPVLSGDAAKAGDAELSLVDAARAVETALYRVTEIEKDLVVARAAVDAAVAVLAQHPSLSPAVLGATVLS